MYINAWGKSSLYMYIYTWIYIMFICSFNMMYLYILCSLALLCCLRGCIGSRFNMCGSSCSSSSYKGKNMVYIYRETKILYMYIYIYVYIHMYIFLYMCSMIIMYTLLWRWCVVWVCVLLAFSVCAIEVVLGICVVLN